MTEVPGFLQDKWVQALIVIFGSVIAGGILGGIAADSFHLQDASLFGQAIVWKQALGNFFIGVIALATGKWWFK